MIDPHAHHILFKKGLGQKQKELVYVAIEENHASVVPTFISMAFRFANR
ncbi:hypothetical protein [Peribacillus simplex]